MFSEEMKQHAALLRLKFSLGLADLGGVVAWADESLNRIDDPPLPLTELAISGGRGTKETLALLAQLAPDAEVASRSESLFAALTEALRIQLTDERLLPDEAAAALYRAAWHTPLVLDDEQLRFCTWIDDEFELVRRGIKERAPVEAALLAYLAEAPS